MATNPRMNLSGWNSIFSDRINLRNLQKQYRAYSKSPAAQLENTQRLSDSVICLPIYSGLSDGHISGICFAIDRIRRYRVEIQESRQ
jgi:dTDP-4-amino-4,6-dideoxygalactose transaminase